MLHKNIIDWSLKYADKILNNFSDEDDGNLVYDPIIFNIVSRINLVNKRGGADHMVKAFEIERYLDLAVQKVESSLLYRISVVLRSKMSDTLVRKVMCLVYPDYLLDLFLPPDSPVESSLLLDSHNHQ